MDAWLRGRSAECSNFSAWRHTSTADEHTPSSILDRAKQVPLQGEIREQISAELP
jgi:hypothetical protein